MNNDRINECKERIMKIIDKFHKEYSKVLTDTILYAPEIQDHECFDDLVFLEEILSETYYALKGVR